MRGPEDAIDGSETELALATATIMHESFDEDHLVSAFLAVVVEMLSRSETRHWGHRRPDGQIRNY
jgi:hypothetical protein